MNFLVNWHTTLAGLASFLTGAGLLAKMLSTGAFDGNTITLAFTSITSGIGLVFAKSANVTGAGAEATTVK